LLTLTEGIPHARVNVPTTLSLAGFQVTTIGRFWVTAEVRWLTHWEFKDVKCPTCNCEFDPTLGMSVRPPDWNL